MNCTAYRLADFDLEAEHVTDEMPVLEDQFATAPIMAIRMTSTFRQPNEEELHTSFEQSISDRVMAVRRQLLRLSGPIDGSEYVQHVVQLAHPQANEPVRQDNNSTAVMAEVRVPAKPGILRQYTLVVCLCLMLVMVGFDLMGMLLLFMGR